MPAAAQCAGTVTSVTAASPLAATTGATPQISLPTTADVTVATLTGACVCGTGIEATTIHTLSLCTCGTNNCIKSDFICGVSIFATGPSGQFQAGNSKLTTSCVSTACGSFMWVCSAFSVTTGTLTATTLCGSLSSGFLTGTIDAARLPATAKCQGTVTSVSAGTGLTAGGTAAAPSLSLNQATGSALGGIIVGTGLSVSSGTVSVTVPTANDFTTTLKNKLDGICPGATANAGTVTSVSGTSPVVSDGHTTAPTLSLAAGSFNVSGDPGFVTPGSSCDKYCALVFCAKGTNNLMKADTVCATSLFCTSGDVEVGCHFVGDGSFITELDADAITTGTVSLNRLPAAAKCSGTVTAAFKNIAVGGQNNIVADTATDTLTFAAGAGISIGTNATSDTLTITNTVTNTNTQNVFTSSWYKSSGTAVCLRLTKSGASSGTQDIKICQGNNITLTNNGTCLTIAASPSSGGATTSESGWTKPTTTTDSLCVGSGACIKGPILCATTCVQVAGNATISCSGSNPTGWLKLSGGCGANDICGNTATGSGFYWAYCDSYNTVPAWMNNSNGTSQIYLGSSISDYRIKQNLACWSASCCTTNVLKQIPVYSFNWKKDTLNETTSTPRVGFLAHEIKDALGDINSLVTTEKDATNPDGSIKPQQISDLGLIPILWSALQETIKKVEDLEERVKTLESS